MSLKLGASELNSPRRSDRPSANSADESPSKRTTRTVPMHLHRKLALLDIYGISDVQRDFLADNNVASKEMNEFESYVANMMGVSNERHWTVLSSERAPFRYRCRLSLAGKDKAPSIQFMNPLVWRDCIYFNEFGAERFLYASVLISREVSSEFCDKTYIKSDFCDREKVKAFKAKWDPSAKKWWFDRKRQDPGNFARWTPHTHPEMPKDFLRFVESGIKFAGCNYKFLCGKASENKDDEKGITDSGTFFHAFFFAERGPRELNWPYVSVQQARAYLGDFGDAKIMKFNHRLNLGFTSIFIGCKVPAGNVMIVPDICNPGGKIMTDGCGYVSADLLVGVCVPLDISSGVASPESAISTASCSPAIIQIRMCSPEGLFKGNLIVTDDVTLCPRGKIVMRDSMKKSDGARRFELEMAHGGGESVNSSGEHQQQPQQPQQAFFTLGIVNTFLTSSHEESGRLNKQLVLLLHSLGVPRDLILSLVIDEVRSGLIDLRDPVKARKTAYKVVREGRARPKMHTVVAAAAPVQQSVRLLTVAALARSSSSSSSSALTSSAAAPESNSSFGFGAVGVGGSRPAAGAEYQNASQCDESSIYEDDDRANSDDIFPDEEDEIRFDFGYDDTGSERASTGPMTTNLSLSEAASSSMSKSRKETFSISDQAFEFLLAGHDLEEPRLQSLLSMLVRERLDRIATKCRIRCGEVFYVVGAPDPLGVLHEGEVYISLWDGQHRHNINASGPGSARRVLVTRSPCMHLGDVRKLNAVNNEDLNKFLGKRAGGMIFFSTEGVRSDADKMSTGDFDGDKYLVISNSQIVDTVQEHEPYHEPTAAESSMIIRKTTVPPYESTLFALTRPTPPAAAAALLPQQITRSVSAPAHTPAHTTTRLSMSMPVTVSTTPRTSTSSSSTSSSTSINNCRGGGSIPFPSTDFDFDDHVDTEQTTATTTDNLSSSTSSTSSSSSNHTPSAGRHSMLLPVGGGVLGEDVEANSRGGGGGLGIISCSSRTSSSSSTTTAEYSLLHSNRSSSSSSSVFDDILQTPHPPSSAAAAMIYGRRSSGGGQNNAEDPAGRAIFEGMMRAASEMTVAASCTAWYYYADNPAFGPDSAEALECHKIFSIAMDAPKTGKSAPCRPDLLNVEKPIYLRKGLLSSGKFSEQDLQECLSVKSSILGEIFKTVITTSREAQQRLVGDSAGAGAVVLDPCYFIHDEDMLVEWTKHVDEYCAKIREVLTSFGDGSFLDEMKKAGKNKQLEGLKGQYKKLFEECAVNHTAKIDLVKIKECLPVALQTGYCFDNISNEAKRSARGVVAAAVYAATYMRANGRVSSFNDKSPRGPPITFCWDICGAELHWVKARSMVKQCGGELFELVLPSEKPYL